MKGGLPPRWRRELAPLARAYAGILFCESPAAGLWFALVTCASPRAAAAGLVGLVASLLWGRWLALALPGEPHLLNGLLTGLFLGAFHVLDMTLLSWVVVAALFGTLATHWLAGMLWRGGRLPVMSLPFVLACWAVLLAAQSGGAGAMEPALLSAASDGLFWPWLDRFFTALGWLLLVPYPYAGALLFAGLLVASRYLALLAAAGYVAGLLTLQLFDRSDAHIVGFNFMLTAMALGGIFAVPGRASFAMALAGGATAGWFAVAFNYLLHPLHLPLLTLPFVGAVYLWLGALGGRTVPRPPYLTLELPQAPELAYERVRLAQVRGGGADSLPLLAPFYGEWRVSQGFEGAHTHRDAWRHALDFDIVDGGRDHAGAGTEASDYYCFGAPVLAPIAGQVVQARDELADVKPGEADVVNNWGNHVLLRTAAGPYVLLAHLRQGSLRVRAGEWVAAGQPLAACGSSGRAPVPHLHLHVQQGEALGSPTLPFHLANVLVRGGDQAREFRFYHWPVEGDGVIAAPCDESLASALRVPPQCRLGYRLDGAVAFLRGELTLLGQSRLVAASGASAAFEETAAVIGFYDRQGPRDALLDLWVLAIGLSPLCAAADQWYDRPAMRLLPLGPVRRLLAAVLRPLGGGCDSRYRRSWDGAAQAWRQDGEHGVRLAPGIAWRARTSAWIAPGRGVRRLEMEVFGKRWEAELDSVATVDGAAVAAPGVSPTY